MPYIRNIAGHPTEDRRQKLDHLICSAVRMLELQIGEQLHASEGESGPIQCFFDFVHLLATTVASRYCALQGKVRYYNYNDIDGVLISALWEMERRTGVHVREFPSPELIRDNDVARVALRTTGLAPLVSRLVDSFDADRGEAVGEMNYALSEVALALVNDHILRVDEAIRTIYAAGRLYYNGESATYEDASINDPDKGDTWGYGHYFFRRGKTPTP